MFCNYCEQELPPGRRDRQYCSNAHRQAHHRQIHPVKPVKAEARIAELEEHLSRLQALLAIEQARNIELEQQVLHLTTRLNVEDRVYDGKKRRIRGWLRKQPKTDLVARLLARETLPQEGTMNTYEIYVRALHGPESDLQEFGDLWRRMLLTEP